MLETNWTDRIGKLDRQIMDWEQKYPDDWHLVLTITEFLVHYDFRAMLAGLDPAPGDTCVLRIPEVPVIGNDVAPLTRFGSLVEQRSVYDRNSFLSFRLRSYFSRFMHTGFRAGSYTYTAGRHTLKTGRHTSKPLTMTADDCPHVKTMTAPIAGFIMKSVWSPWPESKSRKMQIGARIPPSYIQAGKALHHLMNADPEKIEEVRRKEVAESVPVDLKSAWTCDDIDRTREIMASEVIATSHHVKLGWKDYMSSHVEKESSCATHCAICTTNCICQLHEQYHYAVDPYHPTFY